MTVTSIPNDSTKNELNMRMDALRVKLRSQRPSDIFSAMIEVRNWLLENTENQEIYKLLLDAVAANHAIRQEVRDLLNEMIKKGSKFAADALRILPADINDLMTEADDAYYAADYEQAVKLYRQILEKDPNNARAKEQFAKAELNRMAGNPDTNLPRAAIQYFRRARSHVAAKDFGAATNLLNAALETARAKGMDFPEAENLINSIQNLWTADEYREKATIALKNEQWASAWDFYDKALLLNPQDQVIRETLDGLDGLMRADSLLDSLEDHKNDERERKDKLEKIDDYLRKAEEIKNLVNTSLLKKSRERYKQYRGVSWKALLSSRNNQLTGAAALFFVAIFIGIFFLIRLEKAEGTQPPAVPAGSPALPVESTATATSTNLPTPTFTQSPTFTITASPTVTSTGTVGPTATQVIGYGKLTKNVYAFEEPGGKMKIEILPIGQYVLCIEKTSYSGFNWYRCMWRFHDTPDEGWIIGSYIELDPLYTPAP